MPGAQGHDEEVQVSGPGPVPRGEKEVGLYRICSQQPCPDHGDSSREFKLSADGSPFLRYTGYAEDDHNKLLLLFISEHSKRTLEKLSELYCYGTFQTAPIPFYHVCVFFSFYTFLLLYFRKVRSG